MAKLALKVLLLGRHASGLECAGGRNVLFCPLSEPRFRGDCIMVLPEECLEIFGRLCCPPSRFAHDRSRGLRRVAELLRPDPDAVQTFVRRIGPRLADLATEGMPSGADKGGKNLLGPVLLVDVVLTEHEGRVVRCRLEVIEEKKVAVAGEVLCDPFRRFGSLAGKLHADFLGCARQLPGEDIRVAHLSQRRPEPLEVKADVAHPHRIENDVEGAQVGAESTGGDSSLMDVLGRGSAHGGTKTPIVCQESGEALREHGRHHVTECRVRTKLTRRRWGDGKPHGSLQFRSGLGRKPRSLEPRRHLTDDLGARVVDLEFDLPKAQTIAGAALHRDGVVIDFGKGVVGRITQEQALAAGLQLDKLLESLPPHEPLDDRTGTPGDLIRGPSQETSVRLRVGPSAAAGSFSVHLLPRSPCVTRWRNVMP